MGRRPPEEGSGGAGAGNRSLSAAAPPDRGSDPVGPCEAPDRATVLPSRDRPPDPGTDPGSGGRFEFIGMVEAVGIEPTSGNPQPQASTPIAGLLYYSLAP